MFAVSHGEGPGPGAFPATYAHLTRLTRTDCSELERYYGLEVGVDGRAAADTARLRRVAAMIGVKILFMCIELYLFNDDFNVPKIPFV